MAIDPLRLAGLRLRARRQTYSRFHARLYALSVGFGCDPLDEAELEFVVPRPGLRVVPTMATIFAGVIGELTAECRLERPELALHASQDVEFFAPLPEHAALDIEGSIPAVYDRGAQRGAEIHMVAEARVAGEGEPLFRATYVTLARGDGGFGGAPPPRRERADPADGPPDIVHSSTTRPDQALLYALNGDPNPIHFDPRAARKAGFEVPILHGLCTYGIACRAVLAGCCNYRTELIRRFSARFSAPVLPGETLVTEMHNSPAGVTFEMRSGERDLPVLKGGLCLFA